MRGYVLLALFAIAFVPGLSCGQEKSRATFDEKIVVVLQQDMIDKFAPKLGVETAGDIARSSFMTDLFRFAAYHAMQATPEHLKIAYEGPVDLEVAGEWKVWWTDKGKYLVNEGILIYVDQNPSEFLAFLEGHNIDGAPVLAVASGLQV